MNTPLNQTALQQPTQNPTSKTQPSPSPRDCIDIIDQEALAIWHITELLSKLGSPDDDTPNDAQVTLTTATIQHIAQQISTHLSSIMEHVESLNVSDQSSVCSDP